MSSKRPVLAHRPAMVRPFFLTARVPLLLSGLFFVFDQSCKYIAHRSPEATFYVFHPWLGWEFFANPGIAFSVPFPNSVLIIGTPLLLIGMLAYLGTRQLSRWQVAGGCFVFFGAISNLIDRVLFGITIDYLRIGTAVINLADILIVLGMLALLFGGTRTPQAGIDNSSAL